MLASLVICGSKPVCFSEREHSAALAAKDKAADDSTKGIDRSS
jgi:hypothetical protein